MSTHDAVVVGAGPNGLVAAVLLARAGLSVLLIEGAAEIGGGTRTDALTLPGYLHDVCSAVHPLGASSPVLESLPLAEHGLEWIEPPISLAHPFDSAAPALLVRDVAATADSLGADAPNYQRLMAPLLRHWEELAPDVLAPLHRPRHPLLLARFGMVASRSATGLVRRRFVDDRTRAFIGAVAAHGLQPLSRLATASFALVLLGAAHSVGWPFARGGSGSIARALGSYFAKLGGQLELNAPVRSLAELPEAHLLLLDLAPREALRIAGDRLPARYARALQRFQYGPGVFKVDWALAEPVPWRSPECRAAGTLHLAGSFGEVVESERLVAVGEHPERPTVLLAQPTLFDPSRAPPGAHTVWGYCHVPHGSTVDMLPRIEGQIERFAPGFRERVLGRHVMTSADLERHNPNLVGGDIGEGANTLRQLFWRPVSGLHPYRTPMRGLYLCSASTPPGGGVHGMCGYHAARTALHDVFGITIDDVMTDELTR